MPSIPVLLFARYADLLGTSRVELPLTDGCTVADLVRHLRSLPGGEAIPERPFVAVNMVQVDASHRPQPGDEVALLPPMAGG
ncbi:MAG: MoaD/ThiS family protein [Gemmatimonadetes bacterium]|nr:MoaD/ThiS family protein [Gemmatimonadota bacterium]